MKAQGLLNWPLHNIYKYMDTDLIATCAMNKIFGYSPQTGRVITEFFGRSERVFSARPTELREALGPSSKYLSFINQQTLDETEAELEQVYAEGGRFIPYDDTGYPAVLRDCEDAPLGLYYRGCEPPEKVFSYEASAAVVGTRDMSSYGKSACESIVKTLSQGMNKPMIISGLALGIDCIAHCTALENGLPTIAVLPTGIDTVYPIRHYDLAERIASTSGCALVSDFPPGTKPVAICFLRRNRIIAGLALSTILVESKVKGGGMVTARLSASYGRDVYAVSGRMEDLKSGGCNALIAEKLAEPLTTLEALSAIAGKIASCSRRKMSIEELVEKYFHEVDEALIIKVLKIIRKNRDIAAEEICRLTEISYPKVSEILIKLESEGLIETDILRRCSFKGGF